MGKTKKIISTVEKNRSKRAAILTITRATFWLFQYLNYKLSKSMGEPYTLAVLFPGYIGFFVWCILLLRWLNKPLSRGCVVHAVQQSKSFFLTTCVLILFVGLTYQGLSYSKTSLQYLDLSCYLMKYLKIPK